MEKTAFVFLSLITSTTASRIALNPHVASTDPSTSIASGKMSTVCGSVLLQTASLKRTVEAEKVNDDSDNITITGGNDNDDDIEEEFKFKPPYYTGTGCPRGASRITSQSECRAAANSINKRMVHQKFEIKGNPKGCYVVHKEEYDEDDSYNSYYMAFSDPEFNRRRRQPPRNVNYRIRFVVCKKGSPDDWDFGKDEPLPGEKPDDHLGGIKRVTSGVVKKSVGELQDEIKDVAKAVEKLAGSNGGDIKKHLKPLKEQLEGIKENVAAGKKERAAISKKLEDIADNLEELSKVKDDLKEVATKELMQKVGKHIKVEVQDAKDLTRNGINKLGRVVTKTQKYAQAIYKDIHNR